MKLSWSICGVCGGRGGGVKLEYLWCVCGGGGGVKLEYMWCVCGGGGGVKLEYLWCVWREGWWS